MGPPNFEYDIFISYTHLDNTPIFRGQKGWVMELHQSLETCLFQLLGEPVRVWRDPKMEGTDLIEDTLVDRVTSSALLLAVLSPRYLNSKWCLKELRDFYQNAERRGGVRVADKWRIIKVVKTPVPREHHPQELQGPRGYEFYRIDPATEHAREFDLDSEPVEYRTRFEDLAHGLKRLIESFRASRSGQQTALPPVEKTIYLAETTSESNLKADRDNVRRELEQHGYLVLPDEELPITDSTIEAKVREYLQRARLSVHLIGALYGFIPEGEEEERSIVRLQHDLAIERSHDPQFTRIIWLPPGLEARERRQQAFIKQLQEDSSTQHGAELLQTKIEDLKTVIHAKLAPKPKPKTNGHNDQGPARVYLVYDELDYPETRPIRRYLLEQKLEVLLSVNKTKPRDFQEHQELLLLADAVMVYYGHASDAWTRDSTVKLWEVGTGRELATLKGHMDQVYSVAFAPDGKILASGSIDGTVKLWEVSTGREIATLKGHAGFVYSVAFAPDGKTLVSGNSDGTVKLWEVGTGRELATLMGRKYAAYSVAFAPDGKTLASASDDGTVRLYFTATEEEIARQRSK
jgi:WD domain, G-beta repeat/TIR domain